MCTILPCAASPQRWNFNGNMTVSHWSNSNLCLAADGCTTAGCSVKLATCADTDAQRWLLDADDR
jgi:hypothetical protein